MEAKTICPFCCKGDNISSKFNKEEIKMRELLREKFSTFLSRHLGISTNGNICDSLRMKLIFCDDCVSVIESICKLYHELKCLELQLDWKIQMLQNITEHANKIRSRRHLLDLVTLEKSNTGNDGLPTTCNEESKEAYKRVKGFRKHFLKSCLKHLKTPNPRVMIEKHLEGSNVESRNEKCQIDSNSRSENAGMTSTSGQQVPDRNLILMFIKWNLSLSILAMLNCITSPHTVYTNTASSERLSISQTNDEKLFPFDEDKEYFITKDIEQTAASTKYTASKECANKIITEEYDPLKSEEFSCRVPEDDLEDTLLSNDFYDNNVSLMSFDPDVTTKKQDYNERATPKSSETIFTSLPNVQSGLDGETPEQDLNIGIEIETATENSENATEMESMNQLEISTYNNIVPPTSIEEKSADRVQGRYNLRTKRKSEVTTKDTNDKNSSDEEYFKGSSDESSSSSASEEDYDSDLCTNEHKLQCKHCGKHFKSEAWLTRHIITSCSRSPDKKYSTNVEDGNNIPYISINHRKRKLNDPIKSEYICTEGSCNKKFKTEDEHIHHNKLHGSFSCNFCEIVETFAPDLCIHEETHAVREVEKRTELYYYCPRCPYESASRMFFINHHLEMHLDIRNKYKIKRQCSICKIWLIEANQEKHFTSHHEKSGISPSDIFKCEIDNCPAYFRLSNQLSAHKLEIHFTGNIDDAAENETGKNNELAESSNSQQLTYFKCKYCNKRFKMSAWLTQHLSHFHIRRKQRQRNDSRLRQKIFKCPMPKCKEKCLSKKGLEMHSKLHGKFNCQFCPVVKEYAPDIALHEMEHAVANINETCDNDNKAKEGSNSRIYNCSRCKYFGTIKYYYIRHHVEKHLKLSMKVETCDICGASVTPNTLGHHFQIQHNTDGMSKNDIHNCDMCPAYFVLGIQLLTHKNKVHMKEFKCGHCDMTFKARGTCKTHMSMKHKDIDLSHLPETCDVPNCGRKFATKPELEWHTTYGHLYHEKISGAVICEICGKRCLNEKGLRGHMKLHDPNKRTKSAICDQCGKEFINKHKLEKHSMSHAGPSTWPFKCSLCAKTCVSQQKLDEHMRTHTKEKPFVCENCGEKYAHRHNLRLHVKNKHGYELPLLPRWGGGGGYKGKISSRNS